jgi:hypothetical protein
LQSRRYQIDVLYINKVHKQILTNKCILTDYRALSRQSEVIIDVHLMTEFVAFCSEYNVICFLVFTASKCPT